MSWSFQGGALKELIHRNTGEMIDQERRNRLKQEENCQNKETSLSVEQRIHKLKIVPGRIIKYDERDLLVSEVSSKGVVTLVYKNDPMKKYVKTISVFSNAFEE